LVTAKKEKLSQKARGLVTERKAGNRCSAKESTSDRLEVLARGLLYHRVSAV
jgi:hypothetical protein